MHIAIYHDAVIPPKRYGGTERIIAWLAKGLITFGHEVSVIAQAGSQVPGSKLIRIPSSGAEIEKLVPRNVDLLHLFHTPQRPPKQPYLVTIQGNGKPGERFLPNTVFISKNHASNHGSSRYIYNGIDPAEYSCCLTRENHLAFLAKATWKVKNLRGAIAVASKAQLPLEVMGTPPMPWDRLGWKPRIFGVRFRGMATDTEKNEVLSTARGLLFPVRWPEPFGIAVIEALASGCPVFATPYGSLPELITPETGALSSSSQELAQIICEKKFSPEACRSRVLVGFTYLQMARHYIEAYTEVLDRGHLLDSTVIPEAKFKASPETLLEWG